MDDALAVRPRVRAVPPVRNTSASSMQSPPAGADATRVIILSPVFARPRRIAQVEALLDELGQAKVQGEGDRKEQPSIGHQAVVIAGDLDAVGVLQWEHRLGAPCFWLVSCSRNHYPRSTGALSYPFSTLPHSSFRWIGGKVIPQGRTTSSASRACWAADANGVKPSYQTTVR